MDAGLQHHLHADNRIEQRKQYHDFKSSPLGVDEVDCIGGQWSCHEIRSRIPVWVLVVCLVSQNYVYYPLNPTFVDTGPWRWTLWMNANGIGSLLRPVRSGYEDYTPMHVGCGWNSMCSSHGCKAYGKI